MTSIDDAIALGKEVAPRLPAENRAACREKLPGLAVAVSACDELLTDLRLDPTVTAVEIEAVRAVRVMIQACHDMLAEMAGNA